MTLRRFLEASYALMSEGLPPPAVAALADEASGRSTQSPSPTPARKATTASQNTQSMNLMNQMLGKVQNPPGRRPRRGRR